ncbi:transglutaminase-like cysteine peptidase [Rhodoblastus sp.]|uniref:transglutaminase-like cysteine peptidase n=1 Tax=Rhodoblastus sp. TaxID=1962975 RepID=UPI002601A720|nr:transglutaminase-like cysteine peptidase [Rhodoblastus sp.]
MRFSRFLALAFALATAAFPGAPAQAFQRGDVAYASVGGETSIPFGWIEFCQRYKGECAGGAMQAADVNLTDSARREIEQVNSFVNHAVEAVSDMDHWGVVDRWDLPMDGKGDCEDYALMKRKMLIERGYPRQALLITVVRDENNEGHAILTVKTNAGEFILDNLTDEVKPVDRIAYRLVKRQSQEDPNVWVALGPAAAPVYASR